MKGPASSAKAPLPRSRHVGAASASYKAPGQTTPTVHGEEESMNHRRHRLPMRSMGATRRLVTVVTVATLVALPLSSCRSRPQPQAVTLALVDLTRSTTPSRSSTLRDFQVLADQVASEHGRLLVDVIDDNPLAHARVVIDQSFRVPEARGNRLVERKKLEERSALAVKAMRVLLEAPRPARSTDVFGALVSAAQRLQSIPD